MQKIGRLQEIDKQSFQKQCISIRVNMIKLIKIKKIYVMQFWKVPQDDVFRHAFFIKIKNYSIIIYYLQIMKSNIDQQSELSEELYFSKPFQDEKKGIERLFDNNQPTKNDTIKYNLQDKFKLKKELKKEKTNEKILKKREQIQKTHYQSSKPHEKTPNQEIPRSRRIRFPHQEIFSEVNQEDAIKFWKQINQIFFKCLTSVQIDRKKQEINKGELNSLQIQTIYNELNYLSTYEEEVINEKIPQLKFNNKIRAVFTKIWQNKIKEAFLVFYDCQKNQSLREAQLQLQQQVSQQYQNNIINLQTFGKFITSTNLIKKQDRLSHTFTLKPTIVINIQNVVDSIIKFNQIYMNAELKTDVEKEISIWKWELNNIEACNRSKFKTIQKQMEKQNVKFYDQREIDHINQKLLWSNILKLFKEGHADKTSEIFQYYELQEQNLELKKTYRPSATKGTKQDYLQKFETDCKICFCSSNHDNNKVLYCDSCNTSYHQNCYGLNSIPKSELYYCDSCLQQKKQKIDKKNRFICKLCWRKSFPMKNLNGHFYHVTCLVLNNLVQIKNKQLSLKSNITFEGITKKVIESQLRQKYCQFCVELQGCQNGLQFNCNFAGCHKTFHPICAYLNGCLFNLNIQKKFQQPSLSVKIYCNNHHPERDYLQQVYYRRYVCDLKKTSQLDYPTFLKEYKKQEQERLKYKKKADDTSTKINLFKITNAMKSYHRKLKELSLQKIPTQTSKLLKKELAQQKQTVPKLKGKSFFDDD